MIFHDIKQNTEEWMQLRCMVPTSSNLSKIMANLGKEFGEPAKAYAVDIAISRITGKPVQGGYSNSHMDRGHEEEPLAVMAYEEKMFCSVTNGGYFDCYGFGCSPDGLVGDDGVVEIKSAIPSVHYNRIRKQTFDSAYKWQLIGNMKFTEREWIDFISYCSGFPDDSRLYICRLKRKDFRAEIVAIDKRVEEFNKLIDSTQKSILTKNTILLEGAA